MILLVFLCPRPGILSQGHSLHRQERLPLERCWDRMAVLCCDLDLPPVVLVASIYSRQRRRAALKVLQRQAVCLGTVRHRDADQASSGIRHQSCTIRDFLDLLYGKYGMRLWFTGGDTKDRGRSISALVSHLNTAMYIIS